MNLGKGLVAIVILGAVVFFAMRSGKSKEACAPDAAAVQEQAPANTGDRDAKIPVEEKYGFTSEGLNQ